MCEDRYQQKGLSHSFPSTSWMYIARRKDLVITVHLSYILDFPLALTIKAQPTAVSSGNYPLPATSFTHHNK